MQVVGREWSAVATAAWREMLCDRRNSNRCDGETLEDIHMSRVGGKKREKSAING